MKIAYCIICHKNNNILRTTIEVLSKRDDIFIHVDKKSDISEFNEYKGIVNFTSERYDVKWGDFSQVECMINFLKITSRKNYDYICLLSGDDLPIKPVEEISEFFNKHKGYEFIGIQKEFNSEELINRVKRVHNNWYFKKNKSKFSKLIIKIQNKYNLFMVNELYEKLPKLYKGPQWFCITNKLSNYILDYIEDNKWYLDAFKRSYCADEIFFQTIIANTNFKKKIYKLNEYKDDNRMALRYIDWQSGPEYPKILSEIDLDNIKFNNDIIFARKFNDDIDIKKYKEKILR